MTISTVLVPSGLVGANLVPCGLVGSQAGGATIEYFNNLANWTFPIGTFGVATGGGLKALTAANQGNNLVTNGESWTGGPPPTGWAVYSTGAITAVRDFATSPNIAPTGGVNETGLEIKNGGSNQGAVQQDTAPLTGGTYKLSARAYSPSTNVQTMAAKILADYVGSPTASSTANDVWQTLSVSGRRTTGTFKVLRCTSTNNIGDLVYFDCVTEYRQSSLALYLGPTQANASYIWDLPMPASGVVPRGMIFRYAGPLDYWEVRVKPGTAGNDTDIVEVVNGTETVRATADTDFTVGARDKIRVTLNGAVITVDVMKSGATTWTNATSYSTMATGITQSRVGYMAYGLPGTSEAYSFEIVS